MKENFRGNFRESKNTKYFQTARKRELAGVKKTVEKRRSKAHCFRQFCDPVFGCQKTLEIIQIDHIHIRVVFN